MDNTGKNEIQLVIFDLDGVLIESRDIHYNAFNLALEEIDPKYIITRDEHITRYDGNSTTNKLKMLTAYKGLPIELYDRIWKSKQEKTQILLNKLGRDELICGVLRGLKERGYKIYCASNSIWQSVKTILLRCGFMEYMDYFCSNEDVKEHKPNPEIYLKCVSRSKLSPRECLIVEDSPIGKAAANASSCHLLPVNSPSDVTLERILGEIKICENKNRMTNIVNKWEGNINVVIPMAGRGSRFAEKGYSFPKPLIEVNGKPMIQLVVENLNINGNYIFIVQKEHYEKYCLNYLLNLIAPNCRIICVDGITDGAACTVLLAKEYINNDMPILIANSDQFLEWNSSEFLYSMMSEGIDCGISTFESMHPKWSYAKLDDNGYVTEVREKEVISKHATTGIYYWKFGSDFVKYAEQMISKNIRVKNEFYVVPVFNEAIADNKKIKVKDCDKMWGLGVPEDLEYYIKNYI